MGKCSWLISAMLFCTLHAAAQADTDQDSLLIIDSVSSFPIEDEEYEDEDASYDFSNFRLADTVTLRTVSESIADSLRRQKAFEYANDPEYWTRADNDEANGSTGFMDAIANFLSRPAVRAFIYILFIALAIFILIRVIVVNRLYIFNRSAKKTGSVSVESTDEEIMSENLDHKIADAVKRNDQRNAVRFLYLKSLQMLDKKGWINFHPQATNYAYRSQVNRYAKGQEFVFLSSVYEHVYYGNFHLTDEQFSRVLNSFNHFHNTLHV
jgi:hypothetical protein